jgi:hypothetical protein
MKIAWTLLWEEPQSALGALLLLFRWLVGHVEAVEWANGRVFVLCRGNGVSLGLFVFYFRGPDVREHEYGHTFQSRRMGPLYLLLVGIPSVSRVIYGKLYHKFTGEYWMGYFDGWPEKQADRLGGVRRGGGESVR